jgi:2-desacetyl-2-hydroxyethyl bacteriochlorophyllide A dehydrogenase
VRAVVLDGPRSVSVAEVPDPGLVGPESAVVRVDATAICGSDLHLYHGEGGAPGTRLGHEFVGTVEEVGPDVRTVRRGDRVLVSGVIGCGRCPDCLARDPGVCRNDGLAVFGTGPALPGGQAEAVSVPGVDVFALPVPDSLTTEQAVLLTDILPTGFLGARRADIRPGATVVVIGAGPVGVLAAQCAQLFGPARVLVVDRVADRLERVARLGAEPVDASAGDTVARVQELTKGRGAESVIEAVGADQTVADAIMCAAPGGTVSVVGVNLGMALPFPMALALMRRLTFRVTLASIPSTWDSLVPLIASGRLSPEEVFTHRMALSAAADAYRIFDERTDGVLKVLLDPGR